MASSSLMDPPVASLSAVSMYRHAGVVSKLSRNLRVSQVEAEELFEDTKKFLYLAAFGAERLRPTPRIDEGWHAFILFTRDYMAFCEHYFGRYLHHMPILDGDPHERSLALERTLALAEKEFGPGLSGNWTSRIGASDCNEQDPEPPEDDCTPEGNCETPPADCALN